VCKIAVLKRGRLHLVLNNALGRIPQSGRSHLRREWPERRAKRRFPIALPIRCREVSGTLDVVGSVHDISSKGLAFICSEVLYSGTEVELWIDWPFALSETCALQLKGFGRVVRNDRLSTAISISRYEFFTRKAKNRHR
jgi:PilZ domain